MIFKRDDLLYLKILLKWKYREKKKNIFCNTIFGLTRKTILFLIFDYSHELKDLIFVYRNQ